MTNKGPKKNPDLISSAIATIAAVPGYTSRSASAALVKKYPDCSTACYMRASACPHCGHKFPVKINFNASAEGV